MILYKYRYDTHTEKEKEKERATRLLLLAVREEEEEEEDACQLSQSDSAMEWIHRVKFIVAHECESVIRVNNFLLLSPGHAACADNHENNRQEAATDNAEPRVNGNAVNLVLVITTYRHNRGGATGACCVRHEQLDGRPREVGEITCRRTHDS